MNLYVSPFRILHAPHFQASNCINLSLNHLLHSVDRNVTSPSIDVGFYLLYDVRFLLEENFMDKNVICYLILLLLYDEQTGYTVCAADLTVHFIFNGAGLENIWFVGYAIWDIY